MFRACSCKVLVPSPVGRDRRSRIPPHAVSAGYGLQPIPPYRPRLTGLFGLEAATCDNRRIPKLLQRPALPHQPPDLRRRELSRRKAAELRFQLRVGHRTSERAARALDEKLVACAVRERDTHTALLRRDRFAR